MNVDNLNLCILVKFLELKIVREFCLGLVYDLFMVDILMYTINCSLLKG